MSGRTPAICVAAAQFFWRRRSSASRCCSLRIATRCMSRRLSLRSCCVRCATRRRCAAGVYTSSAMSGTNHEMMYECSLAYPFQGQGDATSSLFCFVQDQGSCLMPATWWLLMLMGAWSLSTGHFKLCAWQQTTRCAIVKLSNFWNYDTSSVRTRKYTIFEAMTFEVM